MEPIKINNISRPICWFVLILFCVTTSWAIQHFHIPNYTPINMKTFSPQFQNHCIGRYLINLPSDMGDPQLSFVMLYFGLGNDFKTVEIQMPTQMHIDREKFDLLVKNRRSELKTTFNKAAGKFMLLAEEVVATPNGPGILLRRLDSKNQDDSTIQSELHVLVNDRHVILLAESFPPEAAYTTNAKNIYKLADSTAAERRLNLVSQYISPINNPETAGPGLCFNGVLIDQWKISYDEEKITFDFHSNDNHQPKLTISMNGRFGYDAETLFERTANLVGIIAKFQDQTVMRTVRKTERKIGGLSFQEWAHEAYIKEYKTTQYSFMAQTIEPPEKEKRLERPAMSIVMESGVDNLEISSPYSLHQLEQAWDQWLSTLRLSPGNGGIQR